MQSIVKEMGTVTFPMHTMERVYMKEFRDVVAALREELAGMHKLLDGAELSSQTVHEVLGRVRVERDNLEQRLTAAEQRNATLETALMTALDDSAEDAQSGEIVIQYEDYEALVALIAKPTESGASE